MALLSMGVSPCLKLIQVRINYIMYIKSLTDDEVNH